METGLKRWLMPLLRYGLCLVAIVYLVHAVSWYDTVALRGVKGERFRLLEEHAGADGNIREIVILRDGQRETVPAARVALIKDTNLPDIRYGIRGVVRRMDLGLAWLAIVIFLPVPLLQSIRLVWMLAIQDVKLTYWNAIKFSYAGNFFNFALPGTTGGDVIKAYYITRFTHRKTEAVTTVFLDRAVGLSGLMILASVTFLFAWNRIEWEPAYRSSLAGGLALIWCGLAVGALFVFSKRLRHLIRLPELAEKLPASDQILRIGRATVAIRHHKALVALSLLNTLVLQLIVVIAAYVMSRALGMRGDFTLYFIFVPLGFLIGAIPISPPQAVGVMEAAYIKFFTLGGLNHASAAVAFALANRLTQLVWALPGVLVPLLGAHVPSKEELEAFERTPEEPGPFAAEVGTPGNTPPT